MQIIKHRFAPYVSWIVALVTLAISATCLSSVTPLPLRSGAVTDTIRILWGLIFFSGFGYITLACVGCSTGIWQPFQRAISPLHIAVAQALLVAWFLLRGAINGILPFDIPFSIGDPLLIGAAMVWWLKCRGELQNLLHSIWKQRYYLFAQTFLLGVIALVIAQRELPRVTTLSSDPDQHVYFIEQIRRLATVPFSQGNWGPNPLGYPIGFPLLNFSWVTICGIDARSLITIQPILQSVLAVLALCGMIACIYSDKKQNSDTIRTILTMAVMAAVYFSCLPFGYQDLYYHSEGVGRIGSMLTLIPLIAALMVARPCRSSGWKELSLLGICSLVCITINPVHIVQIAILILLYILCSAITSWRTIVRSVVLIGIPCLLLFADPYFFGRIAHGSNSPTMLQTPGAQEPWRFSAFVDRLSGIGIKDAVHSWFDFGLIDPIPMINLAVILMLLVIFIASIKWVNAPAPDSQETATPSAARAILFPWLNMIPVFVTLAFFGTLSAKPELYLLEPYLLTHTDQVTYLWFIFCIAFVTFALSTRCSCYIGALLLALVVWFGIIHPHGRVNLTPRYGLCDALGCVNDDDLLMVAKLEEISKSELSSSSDADFTSVPKILILNALANTGREEWLFPYGAARILPSYNTLPLAFFYFQGSAEFSFENYKRHICTRIDLKWLRARNIKYVLIPSSRGDVCARGLKRMIEENPAMVIAQSGDSSVVKLF